MSIKNYTGSVIGGLIGATVLYLFIEIKNLGCPTIFHCIFNTLLLFASVAVLFVFGYYFLHRFEKRIAK